MQFYDVALTTSGGQYIGIFLKNAHNYCFNNPINPAYQRLLISSSRLKRTPNLNCTWVNYPKLINLRPESRLKPLRAPPRFCSQRADRRFRRNPAIYRFPANS